MDTKIEQLYDIDFKYNGTSEEIVPSLTKHGDLIIDPVGNKLITHRELFKFMKLSNDFINSPSEDVALSTYGANIMYQYQNNNKLMAGVTNIKEAINRIVTELNYQAPEGLNADMIDFNIIVNNGSNTLYRNVNTNITYKWTINNNRTYNITSLKFDDTELLNGNIITAGTIYLDSKTLNNINVDAAEYTHTLTISTDFIDQRDATPDPATVTVSMTIPVETVPEPEFGYVSITTNPEKFEAGNETEITINGWYIEYPFTVLSVSFNNEVAYTGTISGNLNNKTYTMKEKFSDTTNIKVSIETAYGIYEKNIHVEAENTNMPCYVFTLFNNDMNDDYLDNISYDYPSEYIYPTAYNKSVVDSWNQFNIADHTSTPIEVPLTTQQFIHFAFPEDINMTIFEWAPNAAFQFSSKDGKGIMKIGEITVNDDTKPIKYYLYRITAPCGLEGKSFTYYIKFNL